MRETQSEVVAFSDANASWAPDALRRLVASLADPEVGLRLRAAAARGRGGLEPRGPLLALRALAARAGVAARLDRRAGTARSTPCAASAYVEVDPKWGHDLAFPYRMVQAGKRAVYEPAALAFEQPTPTNETEYARKVRMFEHCWEITLRGSMLRRLPPGYLVAMVSHRVLRYGSGVLHLALAATSVALAPAGWPTRSSCSASSRSSPPSPRASRSRGTTSTSPGRRRRRSGTTSAAGCPPPGIPPRRGEPRGRHRARGSRPRGREPASGSRRDRDQARGRRTDPLPPDARREGRAGLRGAEAPVDGRRRRAARAPGTPSTAATAASPASAVWRGARRSTSCRSSGTSSGATCP